MRFRLLKIFLLFFVMCNLQGCVTDDEPKGASLKVGDPLPDFAVKMNDGETVSTSSIIGKIGVIVFFNTGCPDCQKELPVIQQLWEKYKDYEDILIVPIAREEGASKIAAYWEANGFSMPWSPQENRDVYLLFASSIIPRIYITDYQGIIIAHYDDSTLPSFETLSHEILGARIMPLPL